MNNKLGKIIIISTTTVLTKNRKGSINEMLENYRVCFFLNPEKHDIECVFF